MEDCQRALGALLSYCRKESWAGYDPYDGLNSPLVNAITHLANNLPNYVQQAEQGKGTPPAPPAA